MVQRKRNGEVWRGGKICAICGFEADLKRDMTIDHIIPRSMGGANRHENLQLLCLPCHYRKTKIENDAAEEERLIFHRPQMPPNPPRKRAAPPPQLHPWFAPSRSYYAPDFHA